MGFWSFLRRPKGATTSDSVERATPVPPRPPSTLLRPGRPGTFIGADLEMLTSAGLPGGFDVGQAVSRFAALRMTPDEAWAVDELVRATLRRRLPEPLVVALAVALVDRGELAIAERVLAGTTSKSGLVMLSDLAERRGDIPAALARIERVLLHDLDHPGARERHRRWRSQLGYEIPQKVVSTGATVVTREPDAPFELRSEIGRGGAAAVYEAVDRELGRHVALKVYHHLRAGDREQLTHEARVAVALEGPGIVRVFDVEPEHGWIALEWARYGTLREAVRAADKERLLPIERWALPLAVALARVHSHGWVHHDVKPANVLLSQSGAAILTDFGIARKVGSESPPGSLGYLSPERMAGRPSDPKDDVYAFGRVLEDVLHALDDDAAAARFRPIALACTGPDEARPADAGALLTRLATEVAPPG